MYKSELKNKYKTYSVIILIILSAYFFLFGFIPGWENINSDFPNYYTSSKLILEGEDISNIYNDNWFQDKIAKYGLNEKGKFSPFPPVTSFVMLLPATFNPITAKRIYLVINLFFLLLTALYLFKITSIPFIDCLNIILLGGVGIVNNFLLGQFYLILLFLIVLGFYLIEVKKSFCAGLLWGIGSAVKYFPFIFLPAFFKKGSTKLLFGFLISILILNVIGIYIFGWSVYKAFFFTAFLPHLNGELSHQSQFAHQFQSWNSFLRILFVFNPVENPNPIFNWELGFTLARTLVYIVILYFAVLSFIKLKNNTDEIALRLSLLSVVMLLLSPASASYHFILLAFPSIILLNSSLKNGKFIFGLIFLIIYSSIGFLPLLFHRIVSNYDTNLFFSFHRLWLITFYFILLVNYLLNETHKKTVIERVN